MGQLIQEDILTPLNIPLSPKYKRSYAYVTMKDRVPVILTKALDGLVRDKESIISHYGEKGREELKKVIGYISQLKNELQTNKPLTLLSSIGPDANLWNEHLNNLTKENECTPSYFETDWMYAECYVYRRLREAFLINETLKNIDPFHVNKCEALEEALSPIKVIVGHMNEIHSSNKFPTKDEVKHAFIHLLKAALWGNKFDLSLSCGRSVEVKCDPLSVVSDLDSYVLVDHSIDVWNALADCKGETIDIILDNSGYELVSDLCLAEFLITKCDISKVRFRAKVMPWYISDVMVKDFHYVINTFAEKDEPLAEISNRWKNYLDQGKFEVVADNFWTLPFSFNMMEKVDKDLYDDLSSSKLLIFKGDLNNRKLVGDVNWPTTYPFKNALRGFHPSPLVSLRTIKADVICGLKPGQAEEIETKLSKWLITGDYAVIQFNSEKRSV